LGIATRAIMAPLPFKSFDRIDDDVIGFVSAAKWK
jgi:hypothetical protein